MYDNSYKVTKSIADAARQVMEGKQPEILSEELKGKQQKIDKNKNGKIDAHDFKLLRKEEQEDLDEGKMGQLSADLTDMSHSDFHKQYGKPKSHYDATNFKKPVQQGKEMNRAKSLAQRGMDSMKQEEVEQIQEYESVNGKYVHRQKPVKDAEAGVTDWDAEEKMKYEPAKPARKKYGARQNFVRSKRVNEGFTDLLNTYTEGGIKSLLESLEKNKLEEASMGHVTIDSPGHRLHGKKAEVFYKHDDGRVNARIRNSDKKGDVTNLTLKHNQFKMKEDIEEESTNDEFTAEIKKTQDKSQGKDKAKVAEPKVDAVKDVNEEVEQIEERELSSSEKDKKETYVKSMKKGLQGFKERYGDKGKEVMYATATKMAKKD